MIPARPNSHILTSPRLSDRLQCERLRDLLDRKVFKEIYQSLYEDKNDENSSVEKVEVILDTTGTWKVKLVQPEDDIPILYEVPCLAGKPLHGEEKWHIHIWFNNT